MKVLILHDQIPASARADEADTLVQVQAVRRALEHLGHEWTTMGLTLNLEAARIALERRQPDVVFNLCESLGGFSRLIHVPCDLLEALRLPYTGAPAAPMMLTSNKLRAKQMMRLANLPTATWFTPDDLHHDDQPFDPGRYIIKSVWEHASLGLDETSIITAETKAHLRGVLLERLPRLGGEGFAEAFIEGREFNLAVLAALDGGTPQVLPPAEIVFQNYPNDKPKIVGYSAKWNESSFEYSNTSRRYDFPPPDASLIERMTSIALECWKLFGLRGYARVDFRVDEAGNPWVLEVNSNPCLSPDAGFAAALVQAGLSFSHAIARILGDLPPKGADPFCATTLTERGSD